MLPGIYQELEQHFLSADNTQPTIHVSTPGHGPLLPSVDVIPPMFLFLSSATESYPYSHMLLHWTLLLFLILFIFVFIYYLFYFIFGRVGS